MLERNLKKQGCPPKLIKYIIDIAKSANRENVISVGALFDWSQSKEGTYFWVSVISENFKDAWDYLIRRGFVKENPYL